MDNDIILAMGPPGSRWSGVLRCVQMYHSCINTSDDRPERTYDRVVTDKLKKENRYGWHRGSYFGPGHEFGINFDDIEAHYTKETFLEEIKKPFENWEGVKIIKSHWFAYNIDILKKWFPNTKMIACTYGDIYDMFAWWHLVGGWEIPYPFYTWYDNNKRMFHCIQDETKLIHARFDMQEERTMPELNSLLEIDSKVRTLDEMLALDEKFAENPNHDLSLARHLESFDRVLSRVYVGVL